MRDVIEKFATDAHTREDWFEYFDEFRAGTALEPHGVTLEDIQENSIVLRMSIGDHARQPYGLLHGGISMMLVESAASIHACWGVNLSKRVPVGIEINGSHLRPATEGDVRVVARVIRRSRTLIRHQVEIIHVESGKMLSTGRVTNIYRRAEVR